LTRLRDYKSAVRRIVSKLARLPDRARESALDQLLTLAGLRRLGEFVEQERRNMPVYIDILENKVLGPQYKRGLEVGQEEGRQSQLRMLRRQIEKRFGPLSEEVEAQLNAKSLAALEEVGVCLLDASSIQDLFKKAARSLRDNKGNAASAATPRNPRR